MRILLIAPVHREKEFLKQKDKSPFLAGQGQQSWYEALRGLGHEVFVFRYSDSIIVPNIIRIYLKYFIVKLFPLFYAKFQRFQDKFYFFSLENLFKNLKIYSLSKKMKPELVIISGGVSCLYPLTIKKIKRYYKSKVLLMSGVNPKTSSTKAERKMVKSGIIDLVVENDRGYAILWKKIGAKKTLVLPISSVDPRIHKKLTLTKNETNKYASDVCFVGSLTRERQEILKQACTERIRSVQDDNYTLKIWGDIPLAEKLEDLLKSSYFGTAYGEKMMKIFNASKIVLNFQPSDMSHGGNMRTFEIAGCGAFQLCDKTDPEWFEDKKNIVLFKNLSDLKDKIKFYLEHKDIREKISKEGFNNAHKNHTYKNHFNLLLKTISLRHET